MRHHYSLNQHKIVHKVQPVHKEIPLNQTEIRLHSPISDRFGTGNGRPLGRPFQINRKIQSDFGPTQYDFSACGEPTISIPYHYHAMIYTKYRI